MFLNLIIFFFQHRTTVTISDPEEEMNDVQMRLHSTRRRTSTRHRPHYHKYGRFPPVTVMVTPDDHSDTQSTATPSPNPSSELVRISTLWDSIILIPMNPSRLLLCLLSQDEESVRQRTKRCLALVCNSRLFHFWYKRRGKHEMNYVPSMQYFRTLLWKKTKVTNCIRSGVYRFGHFNVFHRSRPPGHKTTLL